MSGPRPIAAIRADIYELVGDDYPLLGLLVDLEEAAVAAWLADPATVDVLARALVKWGGPLHQSGIVTLADDGRVASAALIAAIRQEVE